MADNLHTLQEIIRKPSVRSILTAILLFAVFFLLLSASMQKNLDHDEHQFIAGGTLLAQQLSFPYLDYAYFHMPNLVFVYAALFAVTDHLLLSARLFSTLCSWLTLVLIFLVAFRLFRNYPYLIRFLIAAGSVIFLLTNPVFAYTSGKAWNHDLPILLTLVAFLLHSEAAKREGGRTWLFFSGLCVGLAIGTRLTFAPITLPFLVVVLLFPRRAGWREVVSLILSFVLGLFVGLLPSLILLALAPRQFVFGNLNYAAYNTLYRQQQGFAEGDVSSIAMSFGGKLSYLARYVLSAPSTALLLLAFLFFVVSNSARLRRKPPYWFQVVFSLILVPFLLIGSFAPTPAFYQYFYAPIPFLLVGVLYGIASFRDENDRLNWNTILLAHIIVIASAFGLKLYQDIDILMTPDKWLPVRAHDIGLEIETIVGDGPVLTLVPLFPLEGGASIYEEFATGPFAWRIASLVPDEERQRVGLVADADLTDLLRARPPAAILLGNEGVLEQPFIDYAEQHGYLPLELSDGKTLWSASP